MKSTSASGATIRFSDHGDNEPAFLLMPGWCSDRTLFEEIAPKLSQKHRVLALDWRGHGDSERPEGDYDDYELVEDALAVIDASTADAVIPVAIAHAGWIAIALRRRLGERIKKLVLMDWIVAEPPNAFGQMLRELQGPRWMEARDRLFAIWRGSASNERVDAYLRDVMGKYDAAMWARAARSISNAYSECGSPLQEMARLQPPLPVLHIYSQPQDEGFAELQAAFAARNPWYSYHKLAAKTHFATFEVPDEIVRLIADFANKEVKKKAA